AAGPIAPDFVVTPGFVVLHVAPGRLWVLDAATGRRLHDLDCAPPALTAAQVALLDERSLALAADGQTLRRLDLAGGRLVWERTPPLPTGLTGERPQLRADGETLLVAVPRNHGSELDRRDAATGLPTWPAPAFLGLDAPDLASAAVDDSA